MALERAIQNHIISWINLHSDAIAWTQDNVGIWDQKRKCYRTRGKNRIKGLPDIAGIWKGRPLYIEVKRPGGRLTPDQKACISKLDEMGAIVFVAHSLDDVITALDQPPCRTL